MSKYKPLTQFTRTYRVICPYGYDTKYDQYDFLTKDEDGIDEWDYFIPLNLHHKNKDWQKMSHLYLRKNDAGECFVCVYITSSQIGKRLLKAIMQMGYVADIGLPAINDFSDREDGILCLKYEALFDNEVMKLLKPVTGGRNFSPKSYKNLPSYNPQRSADYEMKNADKNEALNKAMKDKFGSAWIMGYKKLYAAYEESTGVSLKDQAEKESLSIQQYIDQYDLYDQLLNIVSRM